MRAWERIKSGPLVGQYHLMPEDLQSLPSMPSLFADPIRGEVEVGAEWQLSPDAARALARHLVEAAALAEGLGGAR